MREERSVARRKLDTDVQGTLVVVVVGGNEETVIYRILNFISCTAMLSQKPSMANLDAV